MRVPTPADRHKTQNRKRETHAGDQDWQVVGLRNLVEQQKGKQLPLLALSQLVQLGLWVKATVFFCPLPPTIRYKNTSSWVLWLHVSEQEDFESADI